MFNKRRAAFQRGPKANYQHPHPTKASVEIQDRSGSVNLLTKWDALQAVILHFRERAVIAVAAILLECHNGKTGQCNPSYATIARRTGLARRTVMDAASLLEREGWYVIKRSKAEKNGRLPSNEFRFNWALVTSERAVTSERDSTPIVSCGAANSEPQITINSDPQLTQNYESGNNERNNEGETKSPCEPPSDDDSQLCFNEWFNNYRRKEGKEVAEEEYNKIIISGRATHAELLLGAMRYMASKEGTELRFIKKPANWLREGGWKDEPEPTIHERPRTGRHEEAISAIRRTAEWMREAS